MVHPSWESRVIARLMELKAERRVTFEMAWWDTLKRYPPKARDLGPAEPVLFAVGDDRDEQSLVEFFKTVAWAAWENYTSHEPGQGKALGRFTPGVMDSMSDSSEPAGRSFRSVA